MTLPTWDSIVIRCKSEGCVAFIPLPLHELSKVLKNTADLENLANNFHCRKCRNWLDEADDGILHLFTNGNA